MEWRYMTTGQGGMRQEAETQAASAAEQGEDVAEGSVHNLSAVKRAQGLLCDQFWILPSAGDGRRLVIGHPTLHHHTSASINFAA